MLNSLQNLAWWHWWIVAAALAVVETFVPGVIAIWFAFAALVVGALLLLVPEVPWPLQFVLFGLLGIVALLLWRRYRPAGDDAQTDEPQLNQRSSRYVGEVYTLAEPIVAGSGKVRIGDTVWLARGGDAPQGARVRVTSVEGAVLRVEPA
jgi:membrane protein implicated in regulation of membrane protease activity